MTFAERELRFTFSGAKSGSFSAEGLRAAVGVQAFPGRLGNQAQVKVWGMSLAQMNAYSSPLSAAVAAENFRLTIDAGDMGGGLSQLIDGLILRSFIDLSGAPDSSFNVTMIDTFVQAAPIAAQSQPGPQNAENLIASLCAAAGFGFNNNGAHAVLRNQSTYGSAIDQIEKVAQAAQFHWYFDGTTVWIWPPGGTRDATVIEVGPNTDPAMVGYPQFWEAGITVTSLYNPSIQLGRQMRVTSNLPNAQGLWDIIQVQHDLATMLDGGPWFTTAILSAPGSGL